MIKLLRYKVNKMATFEIIMLVLRKYPILWKITYVQKKKKITYVKAKGLFFSFTITSNEPLSI